MWFSFFLLRDIYNHYNETIISMKGYLMNYTKKYYTKKDYIQDLCELSAWTVAAFILCGIDVSMIFKQGHRVTAVAEGIIVPLVSIAWFGASATSLYQLMEYDKSVLEKSVLEKSEETNKINK